MRMLRRSTLFLLTTLFIAPGGDPALGASATSYTEATGHLQDNRVNDVFVYNTTGEVSHGGIGFDANWRRGVSKIAGNILVNPSTNITLSGTQSNKNHRIRVGISATGVTGTARFQTSLDNGVTWSSTIYTTQAASQSIRVDGVDTGMDIAFASGASWTYNDIYSIASWWGEGAGPTRSSTRDFPDKVAVVVTGVAETIGGGGVEIIDLSDHSVWMRFVNSYPAGAADQSELQSIVADAVTTVTAGWGAIFLGGYGGYYQGLCIIDMVTDRITFYDAGGVDWDGWYFLNNLAQRNDAETDGLGPIGWHRVWGYPRLSSNLIYDIAFEVVGNSFYIALATAAGVDLFKDLAVVYNHDPGTAVSRVALLGDDLYYGGNGGFYGKYNIGGIGADWVSANAVYTTGSSPDLIGDTVTAIHGRPGGSTARAGDNRLYVGTTSGLTIVDEHQGFQAGGTTRHYGRTGSGSSGLDHKVLAGTTDRVSALDWEIYSGEECVYVGTHNGAGGGAVSALQPYRSPGDTPRLFEHYSTGTLPAIGSNNVIALSKGSDLVVAGNTTGVTGLADVPTLVEMVSFEAMPIPSGSVEIVWETASEIDHEGFHLWRAEKEGEQYIRITETLIPAEGGPTWGERYTYIDEEEAHPGTTVLYKLEAIDIYGLSTYHGPVEAMVELQPCFLSTSLRE